MVIFGGGVSIKNLVLLAVSVVCCRVSSVHSPLT